MTALEPKPQIEFPPVTDCNRCIDVTLPNGWWATRSERHSDDNASACCGTVCTAAPWSFGKKPNMCAECAWPARTIAHCDGGKFAKCIATRKA